MANENVQTIRQSKNNVVIEGVVKAIELENKVNSNGINCISGRVTLIVGENDEQIVRCYVAEKTSKGNEDRRYKGLLTFMEYKSLTALLKDGLPYEKACEAAPRVIAKGSFEKNEYYDQQGDLVSRDSISCNSFTQIKDVSTFNPRAEFDIEMYLDTIRPEIKEGEDTGNINLNGWMVMYGGKVVPISFVAEGETAEYIRDNYPAHSTINVWGRMINKVTKQEVRKSGFGKTKADVSYSYERKNLIEGGLETPYEEDAKEYYAHETIKEAIRVRETETLPDMKKNASNNTSKPAGFGNRPASSANAAKAAGFQY